MDTFLVVVVFFGVIGVMAYKGMTAPPPTPSPQLVCPHCQNRGTVIATAVKTKQGISGGKATGALMTGGVSMFATGLSRKQNMTQMRCSNCSTNWQVA